jgi:hypothetical protein
MPASADFSLALANSYFALGNALTAVAGRKTAAESQGRWLEARRLVQRSGDIYLKMRDNRSLTKEQTAKPDEVPKAIARCDAALTRLR